MHISKKNTLLGQFTFLLQRNLRKKLQLHGKLLFTNYFRSEVKIETVAILCK